MARTRQTTRAHRTPAQRMAQRNNRGQPVSVGPPAKPAEKPKSKRPDMSSSSSSGHQDDKKNSAAGKRKALDPAPEEEVKECNGVDDAAKGSVLSKAPEQTLTEFLETLGLEKCEEKINESGVMSVADLTDLEEVDLVELASMAKLNLLQRRRFIRAVADAKGPVSAFTFQAPTSSKDDDPFGLKKVEESTNADEDTSLFAPKKDKQKRQQALSNTNDSNSRSKVLSLEKLKQRAKAADKESTAENDANSPSSGSDGTRRSQKNTSKKRTRDKDNLLEWNSTQNDDTQDKDDFGGETYLFGGNGFTGGTGGRSGAASFSPSSGGDLQEEMYGNRAHTCCSCVGTHDALATFVNNKKFSDVTFLVGRETQHDDEEKRVEPSQDSLDDDQGDEKTSKGKESALSAPKSETCAHVYAVRGVLAKASPVFRALLDGFMLEASAEEDAVIPIPDCTPRGFITMLRFIYTGRPEVVNASNLVDTMYCADKYQLDRLMFVCSDFIRHNLSIENLGRFLLDSGVWVSAGFMKFVSLHGEDILQSPHFLSLSRAKVMNIVASDALAVHDELQIFEAVVNWGKAALKRKRLDPTVENLRLELGDLLHLVRFPQMSLDNLLDEVTATGLLDDRELFSIILYWQTRGQTKNDHFRFNCNKRLQRYIELTYESDWDENGVIYWIGTRGGTENFQNPTPNRGVTCTMSSTEQGTPDILTSRNAAQLYTTNTQNSTIALDLGEDHLLTPNHYSIRHGFASANYYPRNWVFEASRDGSNWETVKSHSNDATINSIQGTGSFDIDISSVETQQDTEPKYRHFRIRSTGLNHSNSNYLMVCGLEIYGKLYTKEKHGSSFTSNRRRGTREHQFPRSGFQS